MRSIPFSSSASRIGLTAICLALAWVVGLAMAWQGSLVGDEWVHFHQIARFLTGDATVMGEYLTTLPGYHWVIAGVMNALSVNSLGSARILNAGFGLACIAVFFLLRRRIWPETAARDAAQFAVLPVLFPFFFLVYTDVLSLLLVATAMLQTLKRRHLISALLLIASMSVRQNNVIWVAAFSVFAASAILRDARWDLRAHLRPLALALWPYLASVAVFLVYWAWHGTISYSTAQAPMHPDLRLHAGNPVLFLLLLALLLPMQVMQAAGQFLSEARRKPWLWTVPALVGVVFVFWFRVDHPYNHIVPDKNVRNALLILISNHAWVWALAGLAAMLSASGLVAMRWARPDAWLLVPFIFVFLAASWLIEPRYSLVPITLMLALRRPSGERVEWLTLALWLLFAVCLVCGILDHRFMI